ncbi:MAG: hypothetical protein H7X79_01170 [Sporomusaceae bacterium]|nr:hypothetical protein [Sporomusaceae bacterium]
MIDTGKVIRVTNEENNTIVEIAFFDNTTKTIVLPHEDINRYKGKYVICAIDSDDNIDILEVVDDG